MAAPWEMDWSRGGSTTPGPFSVGPDPVLAQRGQEEDARKRRDQQLQEQAAAQQAAAAAAAQAEADRKAREWSATHNPDGSPKPAAAAAGDRIGDANTLRLLVDEYERVSNPYMGQTTGGEVWAQVNPFDRLNTEGVRARETASQNILPLIRRLMRTPGDPQAQLETGAYDKFLPSIYNTDDENQRRVKILRELANQIDPTGAAAAQEQRDRSNAPPVAGVNIPPPPGGPAPGSYGGGQTDEGLSGSVSYDPAEWRDGVYVGPGAGPPPTPPPSGGGGSGGNFLSQLGTSTQNAVAGAAQGAAGAYDLPMDIGHAVNRGINWAVGKGGGALLDTVGLPGAADWWRQGADRVDSQVANYPSVSDVIEQASPTPQGMGASRFVSQLAGGAMVPIGPKAAPRPVPLRPAVAAGTAAETIAAGAQNGVRVLTSDVRPATTFLGKSARALGERIPYAGTGGVRAAQQTERIEAVRDMAREFGADAGIDYLDQVADDFAKTRGSRIAALAGQKNAIIQSIPGVVPVNLALNEIRTQIANLGRLGAPEVEQVITRLKGWASALPGKSLAEIEQMRKIMGSAFDAPELASVKDIGQKAINAIYAPLRDDMGAFIQRAAGPEATQRWTNANRQLAQMAGQLDDTTFRNVLNSAEATPENVARLLFSKKPSDVQRLVGSLSPAGRERAQSALISRALEQAGGMENVSPDVFANSIAKLGRQVGVVFNPAEVARVNGLVRLLNSTKQASVASAAPPTGVQNAAPILAAVLTDLMGTAGGAITAGASAGLVARIYESAPVRNLLIGLGRTKPGTVQESRMAKRLASVLMSQSQIQSTVMQQRLMQSLEQSPGRLAAQDQENR